MEAKEAEEESKESSFIGLQEIKIIISKVIPKKAYRENCNSGFQHKPHQTKRHCDTEGSKQQKREAEAAVWKATATQQNPKEVHAAIPDENTRILPKAKPNTEEPNKLDKET